MAKVYVSSTRLDLKEYREAVGKAIRRAGHVDVAMEYYVAEHRPPVEKCLEDVAGSDLYVGLFAWRYGWVPEGENASRLSITEMEYRRAAASGKQCLVFLLSDEAPWPLKFVDGDRTRIEALRDELGAKHSSGPPFKTPDELGRLVGEAIRQWEKEHGHAPPRPSIPELDLGAYFSALTRRYQHLDLDALTPPQRDENLRQRLREIFVEQNVRENPPPVELPKEVWEKLRRDRELHAEDLPAGVTPEDVLRARESYFEKPSRPVLEALTDPAHRHSVILGDPGSGKSTLARYLLLSLLGVEGNERLRRAFEGHLPLLVELRSYAGLRAESKCDTFLEFVEYLSREEGWGLDRKALEHYLKEDGRAVVIFDGLDEIFDPEEREAAGRRIAGFAASYPKARVVVTSRVIGYKRKVLTDADFSHFTLQDLDERQVEQFIDRWYALALDERPDEARARRERIMRSFRDSPSIRQLAGNPMLLTIMAIIGKNQELPRERWKLYDHAAGVLIYHWDVERHLRDSNLDAPFIGEEEKKELLRRLAFKMQSGEGGLAGNYIHRDDLQREFESYLRDRFAQPPAAATTIARAMIDQFHKRNFILSLHGANLYGFVHRAFLEFFCASAFVQQFEKTQELTLEELKADVYGVHWDDQTWHEVLRLICGMIDERFAAEVIDHLAYMTPEETDEEQTPEEVDEEVYDDELNWKPWNLSLAWQCLEELNNAGAVEDTAYNVIDKTFGFYQSYLFTNPLLQHFNREYILPAVLDSPASSSDAGLIAGWADKVPMFEFGHWYGWSVYDVGKFIGRLGRGQEAVRESAARLLDYEKSHYAATSAAVFIIAEGWKNAPDTAGFLRRQAVSGTPPDTRVAAIHALSEYFMEDAATLPLLLALAADPDYRAREAVVLVLSEHSRDAASVLPLLRDRVLNDKSIFVRTAATQALGTHHRENADVIRLIQDVAVRDEHPHARSVGLSTLAKAVRADKQVLALLCERALQDTDAGVRVTAVDILVEHFRDSPQALAVVHKVAIDDPSPPAREDVYVSSLRPRYKAIEVLAQAWASHPDTLKLLRNRADNDPNPQVQKRAEELLSQLEGKQGAGVI